MFKVIVSPKAWQDFFEIFDFIAVADPEAAERFSNSLLAHIDLLTTFPHIGTRATVGEVRSLLHSPIRIYYQIDEQRRTVEIIHFWHGSRRPPKL